MNYFRVGDIYECSFEDNYYGILITSREGQYLKFATLHNYKPNMSTEELISTAAISYHKRDQSTTEKLLSYVLGGEVPFGYFSCFTEKKLLESMSDHLTLKHSLKTLTSDHFIETGGTSLSSSDQFESIIIRCLKFKLNTYKEIPLNQL